MAETRQYMDYTGLKQFWGLARDYFNDPINEVGFKGSRDAEFSKLPVTIERLDNGKRKVNIKLDLSAYALKEDVSAALHFRGVVDTPADLPAVDTAAIGDVYIVKVDGAESNSEYVCVEKDGAKAWEKLGPVIDLSGYYTKAEVDAKCDELAEGIDEEFNRAQTQEGLLSEAITGVKADLTAEVANRAAGDDATLVAAKQYADAFIDDLDERLDAEVERAKAAEADLNSKKQDKLTAGKGILIDNTNTISVDDAEIATVEYVDANISDTMNFIIQERDAEHAGRVAGDELLAEEIKKNALDLAKEIVDRDTAIKEALNGEVHVIKLHEIRAIFGITNNVDPSDPANIVAALDAAKFGDTLVLTGSATTPSINVGVKKIDDKLYLKPTDVTLDLGANTLTGQNNAQVIYVYQQSTIEIVGGTVTTGSANGVIAVAGNAGLVINGTKVVNTNERNYAIVTNGTTENIDIVIKDATVEGKCYFPGVNRVTIDHSHLKGRLGAIVFRGGELTICNGSTIEAYGKDGDWFHYEGGMVSCGSAIIVEASNYGNHGVAGRPVVHIAADTQFIFDEGEYAAGDGTTCKNYSIVCIDYGTDTQYFGDYDGIMVPYRYVNIPSGYDKTTGPYFHFNDETTEERIGTII